MKKAIIITLFDSGCRLAEFLNIRLKDVETDDEGVYYIRIRHSKTFNRTISLPIASEPIRKWISKLLRKIIRKPYCFLSLDH